VDGRWFRRETDWKAEISGEIMGRFNDINGEMLKQMGYTPWFSV
jgi:hypothetical protein